MNKVYKGEYIKGEIEILETVKVFNNEFIDIVNDKVRFPRGNTGSYIRISNPEPYSVAVLPLIDNHTAILIRNFRHGIRGWGYEVPKGGIEPEEVPEEAAKRELREETGYTTEKLVYLGEYSESPAIFSGKMICYVALQCKKDSVADYEDTEAISGIQKVRIDEFPYPLNGADFQDVVTEFLVLKYNNMTARKTV